MPFNQIKPTTISITIIFHVHQIFQFSGNIQAFTFSFLSGGIILWIELPWPENPANTYKHDIRKHGTTVSTLSGLISSRVSAM